MFPSSCRAQSSACDAPEAHGKAIQGRLETDLDEVESTVNEKKVGFPPVPKISGRQYSNLVFKETVHPKKLFRRHLHALSAIRN